MPSTDIDLMQQASKQRLETAMKALEAQNVYNPDPLIYKTALSMVRSASLNCYIFPVGIVLLLLHDSTQPCKMCCLSGLHCAKSIFVLAGVRRRHVRNEDVAPAGSARHW